MKPLNPVQRLHPEALAQIQAVLEVHPQFSLGDILEMSISVTTKAILLDPQKWVLRLEARSKERKARRKKFRSPSDL